MKYLANSAVQYPSLQIKMMELHTGVYINPYDYTSSLVHYNNLDTQIMFSKCKQV